MKKLWMFVLLAALVLGACSPQAAQPTSEPAAPAAVETETQAPVDTSIKITDALGREVTLAAAPQRIVITGKGLILILDAAYMFPEAAQRIVALGKASQGTGNFISLIDPGYDQKMLLENDAGAEQIAAANPDLVILKSYLAETVGKPIEALNIPVIYLDLETPEQYTRDLAILGKVFQNEPRAQEMADFYLNKAAAVENAVKDAAQKPSVLMLYYTEKDGAVAFNVPPMSWIQTRMVEMAGGTPAWASANPGKGWTEVTLEQIAAWDADYIFIISYQKNSAEIAASLKTDPKWQALRAVKEEHLFGFPADVYSWDQSDARWILGLTYLAGRLHPEIFSQLDILKETQQFYQTVYGLNAEFFEGKIRPTFRGDLP